MIIVIRSREAATKKLVYQHHQSAACVSNIIINRPTERYYDDTDSKSSAVLT